MKKIRINTSKGDNIYTLIDDDDFDIICNQRWYINSNNYALCEIGGKFIYLHRLIMNAQKGQIIDHIDGDGLNNQKSNLRFCSHSQNMCNRKSISNGSSRYLGVYLAKHKYYKVAIKVNKKQIYIGQYRDEKLAAKKYNEAAIKYHGVFARLNNIN